LVRGDSQLITPRNPFWRAAKYPIFRSFIPRFDGYLVVGERSRQYYSYYGGRPDRMFFAPHSVDNDFFSERARVLKKDKPVFRSTWGIPEDAIVFLFAGKLIPKKRPMDFVRAIGMASAGNNRIFGLIAGNGPLREEVESFVKEESVPIALTGFLNQSEMPKAYAASNAIVLPSDGGETWGLVVNEAMASGLPCMVSDKVGCAPDLVTPGVTGNVFPCGSLEAMADIIGKWAADQDHIKHLGEQARERIKVYSIESAVTGTIEALKTVSNRYSQGRCSSV